MTIFKRSKPQKLDAILAELRARDATLVQKRAAAETTLAEAMQARMDHMLSGDLADEQAAERLQHRVESAQSRINGLISALEALQIEIGSAEAKIAAEKEAIERQQVAAKLDAQIGAVEDVLPGYLEQARALADALSGISIAHFESGAMSTYVRNSASEVEVAAAFTLAELKNMIDAIREGRQPIPREPAQVVELPAPVPHEPTERVFVTHSIKWRGIDGSQRYGAQFEDVELPVRLMPRAQARSAITSLDDERRRTLHGIRGGSIRTSAIDVIDLDAEMLPPANDPVVASAEFMTLDRGPDRTLRIPAR